MDLPRPMEAGNMAPRDQATARFGKRAVFLPSSSWASWNVPRKSRTPIDFFCALATGQRKQHFEFTQSVS
jgi:hypothetical protein